MFFLITRIPPPHRSGSGNRTHHATSALGVDVTFNIVFFVGGYDEAKTFNYSSEWLDQLESYAIMDINGTISHGYAEYDEQGNPLEQTNFVFRGTTYDHAVFSWDGRQLTGISVRNADDSVAATIAYQYNDQGSRISKVITVGTTVETFAYDLLGSTVHREVYVRKVSGVTQDAYEIRYLIDSDGSILGFIDEGNTYYYLKDLQGDVIGVIDEAGNELVQYEYDAYGNVINDPDDINGDIFEANPYTYRGYRFDSDIGMYYLNSRYYSPVLSRFLNADGLLGELGDIASVNMYAYCANNPILFVDPSGCISIYNTYRTPKQQAISIILMMARAATAIFNLDLTYWMFENALVGSTIAYNHVQSIAKKLFASDPDLKKAISANWSSIMKEGSATFECAFESTRDLYLSLHKVKVDVTSATKNRNGFWILELTITDFYDFAYEVSHSNMNPVVRLVNNTAYGMQCTSYLHSYYFSVSFVLIYKE
ncbi:MAG: RHS repeat-associated core domain-containing protein [Patescibacteria group bacterium]